MHTMKNHKNRKTDIAIIGMGCIFPKSSNLKEYWHLLSNGIDAIEDVPDDTHWKLKDYFDQDPSTPDHIYCKRGGFLPAVTFDPLSYGIPPNNLYATDTSQLLGLEVAKMALEDAGYPLNHRFLEDKKVNVILGVTGTQELVIPLGARLGHPIWKKALEDSGIDEGKRDEIIQRIQGDYVAWQENSFPGLLGNVVAGRIANRLNLSGTNTVSDAACASSLSALHTAVMELVSGKCDMSITGGVDTLNDIFMHMCFAKTGVLSHTSDARPFSKDADGTVLGEGIGMLVLKRLQDAERDGDRIYAVIKGVGTSSDGRTSAVYAPDVKGQVKALKEAYLEAGIDPSSIGLIEAHGTGTRVGDRVEFEALKKCFDATHQRNKTAIGSVKSMIGHTKAAAGAAGMIKTALSLYNKIIPLTLKALEPDPDLDINNSSFYLNADSKPWISAPSSPPRRSGVSAFGFGGSNFHVVLEEYAPLKSHVSWDGSIQIIAFSSKTKQGLSEKINDFSARLNDIKDAGEIIETIAWLAHESRQNFSSTHDFRLLMVHKKADNIHDTILQAVESVDTKTSRANVYFSSGKKKGKLGFLFPGQGSQYTGMGKELGWVFPEAMDALEQTSDIFSRESTRPGMKSLQEYIFCPPPHVQDKSQSEEELRQTDIAQPAIGALSLAMVRVLKRFKITPDITCGHSFGELSALCSAGWLDEASFLHLAGARGRYMAEAGRQSGDSGSMLAIQAPLKEIAALIEEENLDLILANKNSKTQGVLSGATHEILRAKTICKQKKLRAVKLPVAAAFHSHLVKDAAKPFQHDLSSNTFTPTPIEVVSNTTGTLYTRKDAGIRKTLGNQLACPVNFVDNVDVMLEKDVSFFLEVGPKSVLANLTKSILKDKEVTVMSLDGSSGKKSGIEDLAHALCMTASKGFPIDLTQWEDPAPKPIPKKMKVQLSGANAKPKNRCQIPKSKPIHPHQPVGRNSNEFTSPKNAANDEGSTDSTPDPGAPKLGGGTMEAKRIEAGTMNTQKMGAEKTDAGPIEDGPASEHRSAIKGSDMTYQYQQAQQNIAPQNSPAYEAMRMVSKGLEAMQQLQTQTARAHEKFLETQAQASKTLAGMMEQTRHLATPASFVPTSPAPPSFAAPVPAAAPVPMPKPETETIRETGSDTQNETPNKTDTIIETTNEKTDIIASSDTPAGSLPNEPILFEIVSRLTGFPVEMLESTMNIESDLGIDSIKKVEIISELEKQIPSCQGLTTENIGSVRTLKDICTAIQGETANTGETEEAITREKMVPLEQLKSLESLPDEKKSRSHNSRQTVSNVLVSTISDLTGFPVEMLEPSMNLESDLGIDSIKRVEILSRLEQELDHIDTISSDDIANLKTIEEIISYLDKTDPETPTMAKKKTPESGDEPEKELQPLDLDEKPVRQVVSLKEYPTNQIRFYNGAKIDLPPGKKVYITRDSSKIADRFKSEFKKSGIDAQLIDISKRNIPDLPDAAGLVVVPDAFKQSDPETSHKYLEAAFLLAQKNGPYLMESGTQTGAFFTTLSFLGGKFGFSDRPFQYDPIYGGLAGLSKTAAIEWKDVLCRALDMPDSKEKCLGNAEAAVSLMMTHGAVEMGLDGESCNIPTLEDQDLDDTPVGLNDSLVDLGSGDVVMITGGARGVTAACAVEISKQYSPVIVLIGRSEVPGSEAECYRGIHDPAKLKKAILNFEFKDMTPKPADVEKIYQKIISNREIQANMEAMKKNGSQVRYFSGDIRNSEEIKKIFKTVRKEFKQITAVIHGAGVVEDKLILDKEIHGFRRVMETKIKGLENLLAASGNDQLKYLVLFSSVAARTGNQGQCDYSMANEVLNKTAQRLTREKESCKVLSLNWGPWAGGMVNASLKKEFSKRGIGLIPLQAGARQLLREMGTSRKDCPEVIIGAHVSGQKKIRPPKLSRAMSLSLGLRSAPILGSHRIAGEPVVPFALLMEYHALAAEKNNPGLKFAGMDNMRLLKGVKPGKKEMFLEVNIGKCAPGKNGFQTASSITSIDSGQSSFIHSSCSINLKESLPKPPVLSKAAFMELKPYSLSVEQAYKSILFHGNALQGIRSINGYSQKGIEVSVRPAPAPDRWLSPPPNARWTIEPMMLDAAFQAAILWSQERMGQVCLPSFIANLRLYSSFKNSRGDIRILFTVNEESKNRIKGYFTFLNQENQVVASITGFEAVTDPSLNDKFKNTPAFSRDSILAFAQGDPSAAFGPKYTVFDQDRQIARLPRPPYFFMDRVLTADHPQWEMKPGGWIETQYDIPENEWYFKANHSDTMPFAVLLEIALQPCGWLAAYAGSALQSDERLYFRNLGGKASLAKSLTRNSGTVTIRARMTEVSKAGGMIIQDFEIQVLEADCVVYEGTTNFGFFTGQALSNQVGIRNSRLGAIDLSDHLLEKAISQKFKNTAPLTPEDENFDENKGMPSKVLRMIDEIKILSFDGGLYDKGYVKAIKQVDPSEWFFDAHFYQDPVCPGSLGVESFLQMIRFFILKKFDVDPAKFEFEMTPDQAHEWIYRGQITPSNKSIEIHAHIKDVITRNNNYSIVADGALTVDGICIYEIKDFSAGFAKKPVWKKSLNIEKRSEKN